MSCINDLNYEILLKGASLIESDNFIQKECDEVYHVKGGYKVRGVVLHGGDSIPLGVKGKSLIFQFIKPCTGIFVLKIDDADDEIQRLRLSQQ